MKILKAIGKFILFIVFGGILVGIAIILNEQSSQTLGIPALNFHWALILPPMLTYILVNIGAKFIPILQNTSRIKRGIISFLLYLTIAGGLSGFLYFNDKWATKNTIHASGTVEKVKVYTKQGKSGRRRNEKETSVKVSITIDQKLYNTVLYKSGNRQEEYEGKAADFVLQEGCFGWYIIRKNEFNN